MPANLPAEARALWEKAARAKTKEEKLRALQEFLSAVPKHKGTEKLRRHVKSRIAQLRKELALERQKKAGRRGFSLFVPKERGTPQVALVGVPNSGKSRLLRQLTGASVEESPVPFSTRAPTPGMLVADGVYIQLVEVPSIIEGASEGRADGTIALAAARNADAIALAIDLSQDPIVQFQVLASELFEGGIDILQGPELLIQRRHPGYGLHLRVEGRLVDCCEDDVRRILTDYGVRNADVIIRGEASLDQIEERILHPVVRKPAIVLATKADLDPEGVQFGRLTSAIAGHLPLLLIRGDPEVLRKEVAHALLRVMDLIRVYAKEPSRSKPSDRPILVPRGTRVIEVAALLHSRLSRGFRYARVWGRSVRFPGERVGAHHVLEDGDVVEIRAS